MVASLLVEHRLRLPPRHAIGRPAPSPSRASIPPILPRPGSPVFFEIGAGHLRAGGLEPRRRLLPRDAGQRPGDDDGLPGESAGRRRRLADALESSRRARRSLSISSRCRGCEKYAAIAAAVFGPDLLGRLELLLRRPPRARRGSRSAPRACARPSPRRGGCRARRASRERSLPLLRSISRDQVRGGLLPQRSSSTRSAAFRS